MCMVMMMMILWDWILWFCLIWIDWWILKMKFCGFVKIMLVFGINVVVCICIFRIGSGLLFVRMVLFSLVWWVDMVRW